MSASRRLLNRCRRSISQPSLAVTPGASGRKRTARKSSGRTPRAAAPVERKRHKRQCASPDRTLTPHTDLSHRYNPITHQTKTYDCSPSPMPSHPQFRADEYCGSSPGEMVKAKSMHSLLYGSPRRTPQPRTPNFDDASPVASGSGTNSTSTPISKSLTSLLPGSTPNATNRKPEASAGGHSLPASPVRADALFLKIDPPKEVPPPSPRAACALFQTESCTRL